jgi:hypothetical protein
MYIGSGGGGTGTDANWGSPDHLTVIVHVSGGMIEFNPNFDLDRHHVEWDKPLLCILWCRLVVWPLDHDDDSSFSPVDRPGGSSRGH